MAGLSAQLQDARRDEAAASATRDILAEQLHAAADAMAEQVPLADVTACLSAPPDCRSQCIAMLQLLGDFSDRQQQSDCAFWHALRVQVAQCCLTPDRPRSSSLPGQRRSS